MLFLEKGEKGRGKGRDDLESGYDYNKSWTHDKFEEVFLPPFTLPL